MALTMVDSIFDAGPYGHDYLIYLYGDEDKGWNIINDALEGSDWYLATITSQSEQNTIANFIAVIVVFFATWIGVSEAHGLKGWRSIILALAAYGVFSLGVAILGF